MPLCSTGLAPPAFTAPCRNQTSDADPLMSNGHAACFLRIMESPARGWPAAAHDLVASLTKVSTRPAEASALPAAPLKRCPTSALEYVGHRFSGAGRTQGTVSVPRVRRAPS